MITLNIVIGDCPECGATPERPISYGWRRVCGKAQCGRQYNALFHLHHTKGDSAEGSVTWGPDTIQCLTNQLQAKSLTHTCTHTHRQREMTMPQYDVYVPELWTRRYRVEANTPGQALEMVDKFETIAMQEDPNVSEGDSEIETTFDIGCWSVILNEDPYTDLTKEAFKQYNVIPHTAPDTTEITQENTPDGA